MSNFQKLLIILNKNQRKNLFFLSLLLIFISLLEIIFLHSVFLLSNFFTNQDVSQLAFTRKFSQLIDHPLEIILLSIFIIFFLFKSIISIFAIKYEATFIYRTRESLTKVFFEKYLNLPKLFQIKMSASNLTKKIVIQVENLISAMKNISTLFLEVTILLLITLYLLTINFFATIYIFLIFFFSSLILLKLNKKKIVNAGVEQLTHYDKIIQIVNEVFSSLKFFKNEKFNENTKEIFSFHNKKLSDIGILVNFKNGIVRPLFELVILLILASILIYILMKNFSIEEYLPQFIVFLAASYRIMPSYARIITAIQNYKYNIQPVNEYYTDIKTIFEKNSTINLKKDIEFKKEIILKDISFNYNSNSSDSSNLVLDEINLKLNKNSKTCIYGESGSGKSTLLDILMGLLEPNSGNILIDGETKNLFNSNWHNKIGFVSQNIYITNNSLKENIAFGYDESEIDENKVQKCLIFCNLKNFVDGLSDGLNTKLSDLGTNISGGQKQRLGIARALYSSPEILILDEPTNNLDEKNEKIIIDNLINLKDTTLIITTHNKSFKTKFDNILEIKNKTVNQIEK